VVGFAALNPRYPHAGQSGGVSMAAIIGAARRPAKDTKPGINGTMLGFQRGSHRNRVPVSHSLFAFYFAFAVAASFLRLA
jgi:hypothetical protein